MGSVDEAENKTLFKLEEDAKQTKEASLMEQGSLSPTFPQHTTKSPKNTVLKSIRIVILSNKLNLLLPFGPLAILVHYMIDSKVSVLILLLVSFLVQEVILLPVPSGMGVSAELNRHHTIS